MSTVLKRPAGRASVGPAGRASVGGPPTKQARRESVKPSKQPAVPKRDQRFDVISQGLDYASGVPATAIEMMRSMMEHALGPSKDQRDRYQHEVVDMIEKTLQDTEAQLEKVYEEYTEAQEASHQKQEEAREEIKTHIAEFKARTALALEKKRSLADAAMSYREAKTAIEELDSKHLSAASELQEAIARKERLESLKTDALAKLLQEGGSPTDAKKFTDNLGSFNFEEGLLIAVPGALSKAPDSRSAFDTIVLNNLDQEINNRVTAADARIKEAEPERLLREQEKRQAEDKLSEAKQLQLQQTEAFNEATENERKAKEAMDLARKEVTALGVSIQQEFRAMEQAHRDLRCFQTGPKAVFAELRERIVTPPLNETNFDAEIAVPPNEAALVEPVA